MINKAGLQDLLDTMRQHPAFQDLLKATEFPPVKPFRPSKETTAEAQTTDWIYRSGLHAANERWQHFLTSWNPLTGESETSQQEKS